MSKFKNLTKCYKILGINKNVIEKDIKHAYRRLALKWHPDKNINSQKLAEEKFKEIINAYEFLLENNDHERKYKKRKTKEEKAKEKYEADLRERQKKEKEKEKREQDIREKREAEIKRQAEERIKKEAIVICYCKQEARKYQAKTDDNFKRIFYNYISYDFFTWEDEYQIDIKCKYKQFAAKRKVKKQNINHERFFYCCIKHNDKCDFFE